VGRQLDWYQHHVKAEEVSIASLEVWLQPFGLMPSANSLEVVLITSSEVSIWWPAWWSQVVQVSLFLLGNAVTLNNKVQVILAH
jgi:hypothetical protein